MDNDKQVKDAKNDYYRKYREDNREHLREYLKEYRAKNKDKVKQWNRTYWNKKAKERMQEV